MTTFDKDNVIQSRAIDVYRAAYAPAAALPANTLNATTDWSAPFAKVGWTDGGAGFSTQQQFAGVSVDQVPDPLYFIGGVREVRITANLAELSPANIKVAAGMGAVTLTPSTATVNGQEELVVGAGAAVPEIATWGLNIPQPISGLPFRVLVPQGQSTGNLSSTISPTQKGLAALQVQALPDSSFTPARLLVVRKVLPLTA